MIRRWTRLPLAALLIVALALPAGEALAQPGASEPPSGAAKKRKKCKRGYVLKRVKLKRNGKVVKRNGRTVYRKKCKKRKRKAGAQTPAKPDARAVAQAYVNGYQFYRPFASQYTSGEETWRFCNNGRFFYRHTTSGTYTTSEEYGNGTWRVDGGQYVQSEGKEGVVGVIRLTGTVSGKAVNDQAQNNALKFAYFLTNQQQAALDAGNGFQEYQHVSAAGSC